MDSKMTRFEKFTAGITLSMVASSMLYATNGDTLIAVGAKARGMGGAGIGMSHGAESALTNPAMITSIDDTEISFGGTIFMPDVSTRVNTTSAMPPQNKIDSDADINMIPEVSLAHKLSDNWYVGIGMWGTAGMGVDYRGNMNMAQGQYGNLNMVTNLQLMQFAVPVAYKTGGLSVAVSPILQYGNLDINYNMPDGTNYGAGLAQDFGFGWTAGISYDFANGLTLGAVYKSSVEMEYDGQLSKATEPFAPFFGGHTMDDTLEQPAEFGVGFAYDFGPHTIAADYKKIFWSDATGYKNFGWDDQDIIAIGYQYTQDNWALRLGYNHASAAVVPADTSSGMQAMMAGSALNFFNLLGFPATAEDHYTLGGSYAFSEQFSLDLAFVYAPDNDETFATPAFAGNPPQGFGVESITTDHSETSLSFQLTYNF
jgi:long-chain fatty acid transport protein